MCRSAWLTVALVGLGSAPASAIKLVGTDGRDEISVTPNGERVVEISPAYAYVPPAAGTSDADNCAAILTPVSALPDAVVCHPGATYTLTIDLGGGDDVLRVRTARISPLFSTPESLASAITIDGGAGADDVAVESPTVAPIIKGGDGDDVLAARGADNPGTTGPSFDGGAGRDLVDFAGASPDDAGRTEGVDADLTRGTARFVSRCLSSAPPTRTREDRLISIERVSGTSQGDILTGTKNADELIGGDGADRIDGRDGDDIVSGGADEDVVIGGAGRDMVDGGPGLDQFPAGSGGDKLVARDGAAEVLTCVKDDTVIDDLTDRILGEAACGDVSTAPRSHVLDTVLTRRALVAGRDRGVLVPGPLPEGQGRGLLGDVDAARGNVGARTEALRSHATPRHACAADPVASRAGPRPRAHGHARSGREGRRRPTAPRDLARAAAVDRRLHPPFGGPTLDCNAVAGVSSRRACARRRRIDGGPHGLLGRAGVARACRTPPPRRTSTPRSAVPSRSSSPTSASPGSRSPREPRSTPCRRSFTRPRELLRASSW